MPESINNKTGESGGGISKDTVSKRQEELLFAELLLDLFSMPCISGIISDLHQPWYSAFVFLKQKFGQREM